MLHNPNISEVADLYRMIENMQDKIAELKAKIESDRRQGRPYSHELGYAVQVLQDTLREGGFTE